MYREMAGRVKHIHWASVLVEFNFLLSVFLHFTDFHSEHIVFINQNNRRNLEAVNTTADCLCWFTFQLTGVERERRWEVRHLSTADESKPIWRDYTAPWKCSITQFCMERNSVYTEVLWGAIQKFWTRKGSQGPGNGEVAHTSGRAARGPQWAARRSREGTHRHPAHTSSATL